MAITRTCDICQTDADVERYSMQHKQRVAEKNIDGVVSTKSSLSMGGIDLCFSDWLRIAEPRMKDYITDIRACDICGNEDATLRLTLKQSHRTEHGTVKDRGRGSIVLCRDDWRRIGLPLMRRKPNRQQDPARLFAVNAERHAS